jgi:hypothetical protein
VNYKHKSRRQELTPLALAREFTYFTRQVLFLSIYTGMKFRQRAKCFIEDPPENYTQRERAWAEDDLQFVGIQRHARDFIVLSISYRSYFGSSTHSLVLKISLGEICREDKKHFQLISLRGLSKSCKINVPLAKGRQLYSSHFN